MEGMLSEGGLAFWLRSFNQGESVTNFIGKGYGELRAKKKKDFSPGKSRP